MSSYNEIIKGCLSGKFDFFRIFNSIGKFTMAEIETLSFVLEQDNFHLLLNSMKESREGKIVSFNDAFGDLNK